MTKRTPPPPPKPMTPRTHKEKLRDILDEQTGVMRGIRENVSHLTDAVELLANTQKMPSAQIAGFFNQVMKNSLSASGSVPDHPTQQRVMGILRAMERSKTQHGGDTGLCTVALSHDEYDLVRGILGRVYAVEMDDV